jgi:single-strand DNA-binding protein
LVYVEGSLRTSTWEGKDGLKRTTLEVNADRVLFIDSRQGAAPLTPEDGPAMDGDVIEPEDIPF